MLILRIINCLCLGYEILFRFIIKRLFAYVVFERLAIFKDSFIIVA